MKRRLRPKLAFVLLAKVMLVTLIIVPLLSEGIFPTKVSALSVPHLKSNAGAVVIPATDLFVTANGTAPKAGVDSVSVSAIENLLK